MSVTLRGTLQLERHPGQRDRRVRRGGHLDRVRPPRPSPAQRLVDRRRGGPDLAAATRPRRGSAGAPCCTMTWSPSASSVRRRRLDPVLRRDVDAGRGQRAGDVGGERVHDAVLAVDRDGDRLVQRDGGRRRRRPGRPAPARRPAGWPAAPVRPVEHRGPGRSGGARRRPAIATVVRARPRRRRRGGRRRRAPARIGAPGRRARSRLRRSAAPVAHRSVAQSRRTPGSATPRAPEGSSASDHVPASSWSAVSSTNSTRGCSSVGGSASDRLLRRPAGREPAVRWATPGQRLRGSPVAGPASVSGHIRSRSRADRAAGA